MYSILAILAGILLGIFSGLIPGIHSNTISSIMATMPISTEMLPFLIVAVFGANMVIQFLPSIFFSIPDDSVVTSVLPGHRMALQGRGKEAVTVIASSVLLSSGAAVILLPISFFLMPALFPLVQPNTASILIAASLYLVLSEKTPKKIAGAFIVFLLAGALGMATINGNVKDVLFPAFSGLFAVSGIILSMASSERLPKQTGSKTRLDYLPWVAGGIVLGMLCDLLPGISAPAQIAALAFPIAATRDARKYLALVASIAASHAVFAFSSIVSIGKARVGSLAVLNQISPITNEALPALIGTLLIAIGTAAFVLSWLSKHADKISALNTREAGAGIIGYLALAVFIISDWTGLIVLLVATAIGLLPHFFGVKRTHVMGLIIIPSIMLSL